MPKIPKTQFVRRVIMFVEDSDRAAANVHGAAMDPPGGSLTFSTPCSSDGNEPVTFWASNCVCKLATYNTILGLQSTEFPTGSTYRGHHPPDDEVGPTRYTWLEALTAEGLQVIDNV